jgi:hypothetical protein
MSRRMAREILMRRGRRHYPDEDFETVIQHIMDDYDPESHFDEQMEDFLRNHPEYATWHWLFTGEEPTVQDWKKEQRTWLEREAEDYEHPIKAAEARSLLEDLILTELAIEAMVEALRWYQPSYLKGIRFGESRRGTRTDRR